MYQRHRSIYLLLVVALLLSAWGCASTATKAVSVYEATGNELITIHDTLRPACDRGDIDEDTCAKIAIAYMQAKDAYIKAGDALAKSMDLADAIQAAGDQTTKESLQQNQAQVEQAYMTALKEASSLVTQLINLAASVGIQL